MSEDTSRQVRFYLDPVSPYTYLALMRAREFSCAHRAVELAVGLAVACWGDGRPLTDLAVIEEVVVGLGLDAAALGERIGEEPVKRDLRDLTREALERGIFGVPSFEYEGDIFWGHDRLDHLAARLTGALADLGPELDEMEHRPSGVTRKRAPDPQ